MAQVTFKNMTPKQARVFAEWYEGQGEQDAEVWFDTNDTEVPIADINHEGGCVEVTPDGDVIVYCMPANGEEET